MISTNKKIRSSKSAIDMLGSELYDSDFVLGLGAGSTVLEFAKILDPNILARVVCCDPLISGILSSKGIKTIELNECSYIDTYIDGADEANAKLELIKGKGGFLTLEKILAHNSKRMICLIDDSKLVHTLGAKMPVPIEVLAMARSYISRMLVSIGGRPILREGYRTINNNQILDVYDLDLNNGIDLELLLNKYTGLICSGIFAIRKADQLVIAYDDKVDIIGK